MARDQRDSVYIRSDPCEDHLSPPSRLNGSTELRVIPSIHLTVALDVRRVRMHL